jgi:NADPH2:quinone reductase
MAQMKAAVIHENGGPEVLRYEDVAARAGSQVEARSLWTRNNALHGVFLGGAILSEYARVHPMIGGMLERVASGELLVEIDRSFPLADAAAAHEYAESRRAFGRVVLTV